MQVVSVNVGLPREIEYRGELVLTGIFKVPTEQRIAMRKLNLDGDRQADIRVHGGPEKAVYAYPMEHYPFWRALLHSHDLPHGSFGENLTIEGMTEDTINIGDRFRIGSAEVVVTQPRIPCFKLAAKFDRTAIVKEFLESGFSGFYVAVAKEGEVGPSDTVEVLARDPGGVRVSDLNRLYRNKMKDRELMRRAVQVNALAAVWREMLTDRLERGKA